MLASTMVFPELQSTNSARLKWVVGQTTASQGTFVEEPFAILHATSIFWGKRFQKACSSWKSSRSWLFEFMWRELMWRKTKVEVQLVFQPWFCSRNVWERFFVVKSTCTAWDGCKLFKFMTRVRQRTSLRWRPWWSASPPLCGTPPKTQ